VFTRCPSEIVGGIFSLSNLLAIMEIYGRQHLLPLPATNPVGWSTHHHTPLSAERVSATANCSNSVHRQHPFPALS